MTERFVAVFLALTVVIANKVQFLPGEPITEVLDPTDAERLQAHKAIAKLGSEEAKAAGFGEVTAQPKHATDADKTPLAGAGSMDPTDRVSGGSRSPVETASEATGTYAGLKGAPEGGVLDGDTDARASAHASSAKAAGAAATRTTKS